MSDMAIRLLSAAMNRTPAAAGQSQAPAKKTAAPKTDVIDLSKPPTPEQAERMRGAGFLGYGSVSITQMTCTWEDGSYWEVTLHECSFNLELGGRGSYYIPPQLNEDGSWSLAEYGPSAQFTVSGYHSVFSFVQSSGGQTQYFWSETFVEQVRGTIPGGTIPSGAAPLPPACGRDLLDRLDRLADQMRRSFDARA